MSGFSVMIRSASFRRLGWSSLTVQVHRPSPRTATEYHTLFHWLSSTTLERMRIKATLSWNSTAVTCMTWALRWVNSLIINRGMVASLSKGVLRMD